MVIFTLQLCIQPLFERRAQLNGGGLSNKSITSIKKLNFMSLLCHLEADLDFSIILLAQVWYAVPSSKILSIWDKSIHSSHQLTQKLNSVSKKMRRQFFFLQNCLHLEEGGKVYLKALFKFS